MAFMKYINDPIGILTLVVLILPSIAANIDCDGKPFHCVNSTHFMICVDLGSGVSSTIDDFVIPCPPTTECQGTNRFECEFPAVPTTTTTIFTPSATPQVTSVSQMIGIEPTTFYDVTTSIPFEEYFNTLSTTTLSEDVLMTQQAIVTDSILVTDVTDKTDVITPEFESNSTLSGTIPRATNFTPFNNLSSPAFPTNVSDTVIESIFSGVIETTPNINLEMNLTTLNTELPDKTVDIVTVTENINLIEPKSNLSSNRTIPSGNILGNDSTIHNTQSRSELTEKEDAIVQKNIVTEETESENVVRPEPNTTLSETPASVEIIPIDLRLLNESDSTGKGTESFVTNVTDNVLNDLTSLYDSGSTAIVDTEAKVTSMTENLNVLQPNITFSETPASVDVVQNYLKSLNTSSSTSMNIISVNHVTENIKVKKPGPDRTLSETLASADVTHGPPLLDASSSTTIDTEAVTNVTENLNVFEPEPNTTLSNIPESVDVIQNYPTLLNASSNTGIDIEAITNVTENINVIKPGFNTTLRKTPRIDDVITHDPTSLDALSSTAIHTGSVTNETEELNAPKTEPNTILTKTPASVDVVTHEPTSLNVLNSTAINTEAVTNVTDKINLIKPGSNRTLSESDNTHDSSSLAALSSTAIDTAAVTNVTEDLKVIKTEPTTVLSETPESVNLVQNNPISLNTSTTTAIDTKYMIENISVIKPEPVNKLNIMPAKIDVILNDPISLTTSSSTAFDTETVTKVTDNINAIKPGPNTLSATFVSDDFATHDPTSLDAFSSTAIGSESGTNETEKLNVLKTESNTILTETLASIDVVTRDPTSLEASNSTAIETEAVTNATENLNVIKTEPTTKLSETPESVSLVQNNPTPLKTLTITAIGTKNMKENIHMIKPEPITTLNEIPTRIDVILNDLILLTTSSSTLTDTEAGSNITDTKNVIKPAPNTTLSVASGSDDVVTYDPTSLDATSTTAVDTESLTNVTENLNVIKTEPTTILNETPVNVSVVQNNSKSLNTSTTSAIDTKNMIKNINVIKPEHVKKLNIMPTRIDVILNDPISLTTSSSTTIDIETVTNVTDNINTIKPGPNTLSETFGSDDVVTHDSSSLDALSSTAFDIESVTNEIENLNDIKTEPSTILSETSANVDVVTHGPTLLDALSSTASNTEAITNVTDTINLIKPGPNTTFSGTTGSDNIVTHDPTLLDPNTDNINTYMTDNINVIKPELNTTLGRTLTSFDVVLNNPTSLSTSSSTHIDSVSNDVMQNEFTTPYTPNSTASLNNTEPITSDILLIDKTVTENIRILETTRPTQEIDSVSNSNVYHTDFVSVINIGNSQEVLTNQTDGKPVHSEKVQSTSTIENTTSTPTLAIIDKGIIFTNFVVSVTDAPIEHPVSELKPNSNMDSIFLDTYPTTTKTKNPFTDIPVSEPPTEVTPSLVTDTTGVISELDAAVVNDNIHNATHLESNSTKKSVQANKEVGSELSPYFTTPEFVSNTESPKEIYFITAKQLTPVSIVGDRKSTEVNDNNQLVTKYNKPMDSSSISSIDKSSVGFTNIPVITESVNVFTNTEQSTLASIFTIIEAATIATTSTTTHSSKNFGLSSSTNIGQHSTKEVEDINVTAFISEKETDKFYNTRLATETRPVTIIEEPTLLEVNTVSSTTSSVPEFEPTTTEVIEIMTTTAAKNSYVEPPLYLKSVETTFSSLFNLQSETTPSLEITTGSNGIGDVLSINFNQTNISRNSENTALEASSTVTQEIVTGLTHTELPVQNSTTAIVITNTLELSTGSLEDLLPTNSLGDGKSLTSLTASHSSVNEGDSTVKAAGQNKMFKNSAMGTANIEHDVKETKESNPLISLLLDSATAQTLYKEYTIPAQRKLIQEESVQAKQIVVPGQAEKSLVDYLGNVPTLHSIATEAQIPEEVQQQQSSTAIYEDTSNNQKNAVSEQGSTPTNSTRDIVNKDTKKTNNASFTKVNKKTETNVPSTFDSQSYVKANMQNQNNKVEDSYIVAQSGSTSSHSAKNFSPTSIPNSKTLSHLEQNTESWRATVVTNPSVQMKNSDLDKLPLITTTRPATEPAKISKIEGIHVQNTGPNLDVVVSNTKKQFINVSRVISPSIIAAKALIDVTSTTGPHPKPSNKISKGVTVPRALDPLITNPNVVAEQLQIVTFTRPNTASWNIQIVNLPSLDLSPKAEPDNNLKNIDGGQTTVDHVVSITKTELINVPRIVISQTTEQTITQTSLDLNSDVDTVMAGIVKPINANPVLGEPTGSGTHSWISVIPKPPHKSPVEQSEKIEASKSVKKSENTEGKEWVGKSETPESIEGEQNVGTPAIETTVAISKGSKFDNVNDNIDQKGTSRTVDSKLQYTTYNIVMENTIEMTTKKIEEKSDQSISNIEQYSSIVKTPTKKSAQTKVKDVVSPDLKGKSVNTKPITAFNSGNITSTIKNSTARFSPQTKSPLGNKNNSSDPILKPATNSHKFVCKLNKRGRFSDIKDCRKFYICLGRVDPIEGICPNNTVFSELRKQCTKNLSHCVRNSQFQCVSEGRFRDYLSDGIYYICVKNNVGKFIRFKLQCQSGYHLNKTSVRCDMNTESSQSTSQQSTGDISKDNNQSVSWAKNERLKEPSKNKKFECKKEGKFPEANDCRKYYICKKIGKSQYQQKSKKCDSDELFHKDKKKCVDSDSYECS